jgi:ABC-2 type transport system ATP-binding protein
MELAIETHHLTKAFEKPRGWRRLARQPAVTAVNDVTLAVEKGELFGLLGPNGAGKTTLVKMLCTLILPTSGTAAVAGYPLSQPGAIRAAVGLVVSDERSFYWRLSGRENLQFFAAMYQLPGREAGRRVEQALDEVDLLPYAGQVFQNYSTGMRQRLAIARSLLHRPQVLFLDEPSRSLDPVATARLHDLVLGLIDRHRVTVFLITHDLLEAEKLCRRVAVLHRGRIRAVGKPADLRRRLQPHLHYTVRSQTLPPEAAGSLRQFAPDLHLLTENGYSEVTFEAGENDGRLTAVLDYLRQHGRLIHSIQGQLPTLEEVFAHYTSEEEREKEKEREKEGGAR